MLAGRMYIAGEHGQELIMMGQNGYAYNHHETRGIMSGGGEHRVSVYMGPEEIGRALDHDISTMRGRRRTFVRAKWGRKLQGVSY
jgi:hypothetical protein